MMPQLLLYSYDSNCFCSVNKFRMQIYKKFQVPIIPKRFQSLPIAIGKLSGRIVAIVILLLLLDCWMAILMLIHFAKHYLIAMLIPPDSYRD